MFIFYTLIVILAVALISDSLSNAALMLSVLINVLLALVVAGVIPTYGVGIGDGSKPQQPQPQQQSQPQPQPPQSPPESFNPVFNNLYGNEWNNYDAYKSTYFNYPKHEPYVESSPDMQLTIDQQAVLMAQRRTRDKRQIDGMVSKDVNFYKYHFGNELDVEENKPWWGRNDY